MSNALKRIRLGVGAGSVVGFVGFVGFVGSVTGATLRAVPVWVTEGDEG
jgi:hypothetical protein